MKNLLLTEKYRPKKIEDLILLPRIKKIFENGINDNVILYGHCGTGKTSLANILIGKYTKDKPYLLLNGSNDTSIDILRTKIDNFCSTVYMGLDLKSDIKSDDIKYVFLDECERISAQYQDALKAYIEDKSVKNVRFILVTNHINRLTKELKSRFLLVNFDCIDSNEEKYLKNIFYKRTQDVILKNENFTIQKEDLVKIINKGFPDFRQVLIQIDNFRYNGEIVSENNINLKLKQELYENILNKKMTFNQIYHYINETFGQEKIDVMINLLGRDFIKYITENKADKSEKLFELCNIITEHTKLLETNTDPLILGITIYSKVTNLFNI
jgi:replication-associated recombination protein RarA